MLKHTSLIVAGALVLGMGISTASFAEMPSLDSQSYTWPGSTINTSSDTDKIAPDPKTGKRPGILDWEGIAHFADRGCCVHLHCFLVWQAAYRNREPP